ncbi:MAG: sugar transferase [Clostridium sp.]|nr:sugar transferase [Clostridium sp.]
MNKKVQINIKDFFDLIFGIFLLIIMSPIFIIISIAIIIDSRDGILFKQERIGKDGKKFKIYKFRTMVKNAEKLGDGLIIKDDTDNRVTKVGKFLRRTSLDELPQIFNIIRGEMSFVGPRPPVIYHPYDGYENYSKSAKKRFLMKPGITGLAQVEKRNSASWDERIEIDVKYVESFSMLLDLKIIFKTIRSLINKEEYTQ